MHRVEIAAIGKLIRFVEREFERVDIVKKAKEAALLLFEEKVTGKDLFTESLPEKARFIKKLMEINCPHIPKIIEVEKKFGRNSGS